MHFSVRYYSHESRLIFLFIPPLDFRSLMSSFDDPIFIWTDGGLDGPSVIATFACCVFWDACGWLNWPFEDDWSITVELIVTACGVPSFPKSLLFAAAATARRSLFSATSCSRSSSSASLRYKSLNSSSVISERAAFLDDADSPERMPFMIPMPPESPPFPLVVTGVLSSCEREVPVVSEDIISAEVASLDDGSR